MKTAIVAAVYFAGLLALVATEKPLVLSLSKSLDPNFQRQPLISPLQNAEVNEFKRIKRQHEQEGNEQITTVPTAVERFQAFLRDCKGQCGARLGFEQNEIEKPLLFEENPTPKEKCLMACVLERTKIMNDDNKVSLDTIGRLASLISNNNELIIAIARATAENCNRSVDPSHKCEAAAQINRCIAQGLKTHKVHIIY